MSGAGFIRRFTYVPGVEELTAIEGVVIVDQKTPGAIRGASYGTVGMVGEAADMSYCCTVNTSGVVVSSYRPQEVFGGADVLAKIGPCDPYLGKFGSDMGNLFVAMRNKRFSRLVVLPVDLIRPGTGSQYAIRVWRQLPTNTSATDVTPIVAVSGTQIQAGTHFQTGGSVHVILAAPVTFTGEGPRSTGVDGTTEVGTFTGGPPATSATVTIVRAAGSFITDGVVEGDMVVPGSLNAASASQNLLCAGAGTLRVVSVDSATQITCQKLNGDVFTDGVDWEAGSALAYRVHPGATADTGGEHQLSEAAGYTVLARPFTATVSAATDIAPVTVPLAATGTYWDVDAGLAGITHPSGALTYDANVHAANPATNATLRARYLEAIDAFKNDDYPTNEVSILLAARKDATIQAKQREHALFASARGLTRTTVISPTLTTLTKSAVLASSAPGVGGTGGAVRSDRLFYSWPGVRTFIPELVGTVVACSDGSTTDDGIIDVPMDEYLGSLLSLLQPELNPGQAADPVPLAFSSIIGYQRGCPTLDMEDYKLFKQYGIAAIRMDRTVGPVIQSGITTSLTSGETLINRRRMADFIQDSLAARYNQMAKMLGRQSIKDSLLAETEAFLADLLSENNPEAQRIDSYSVDDKSANTPALSARGVHIIKSVVRMLNTLDTIVAQTEISPDAVTVTVT